jgi:hypothetical protein
VDQSVAIVGVHRKPIDIYARGRDQPYEQNDGEREQEFDLSVGTGAGVLSFFRQAGARLHAMNLLDLL